MAKRLLAILIVVLFASPAMANRFAQFTDLTDNTKTYDVNLDHLLYAREEAERSGVILVLDRGVELFVTDAPAAFDTKRGAVTKRNLRRRMRNALRGGAFYRDINFDHVVYIESVGTDSKLVMTNGIEIMVDTPQTAIRGLINGAPVRTGP